jgi:hypothetical protein
MKVATLIKMLKQMPQDMDVITRWDCGSEYGLCSEDVEHVYEYLEPNSSEAQPCVVVGAWGATE